MRRLFERHLPWRLRWVAYIRPSRPAESARLVVASWRRDAKLPSMLLHALGEELIEQTLDACREVGARPFLAFGTLLGHHRDGGFIAHDADIDFGLRPADFDRARALRAAMERRGFAVRLDTEDELSFYKPFAPTLLVDFFRFFERDGHAVYYDTRGDTRFEYRFPPHILEVRPDRFKGRIDVWVPGDVEAFLTASYGDWRTPRSVFDNVNDHPNRRVV
jgi:hypothetical protein